MRNYTSLNRLNKRVKKSLENKKREYLMLRLNIYNNKNRLSNRLKILVNKDKQLTRIISNKGIRTNNLEEINKTLVINKILDNKVKKLLM